MPLGLRSAAQRTRAITIDAIVAAGGSTRLLGRTTAGTVEVDVAVSPNPEAARRWRATVRRVSLVTFEIEGDVARCRVSGHRNRLPFTTTVPLAIGLGLIQLGAPGVVAGLAGT